MPLTLTPVTPGSLTIATVTAGAVYNSSAYIAAVIADSPRVYYRLGESSGDFADSSGNAHTGTAVGTISYSATGALTHEGDAAIKCAGTGYVTVASHADLNVGDTFTLEWWYRKAVATEGATFLDKGVNGFQVRYGDPGGVIVLNKAGVSEIVRSTSGFADTNWHHYAITKSGAAVHMYIDAADVTGVVTNATISNTAGVLYVGADNAGGISPGSMDEVALYPTALSAARITAHYAAAGYTSTAALTVASPGTLSISPVSPS